LHSFASRRHTGTVLLAVAAAALLLPASNALAEDSPPAFTSGPTIVGDAVVGATLTADATWTGEPPPQVRYAWRRCPATGGACQAIEGAETAQYLVTSADLGFRLGLRMQLKSKPFPDAVKAEALTTAVVVEPTPPPSPGDPPPPPPRTDPDPDPDPGQTQDPDPTPTPTPAPRASFPEPVAPIVSAASRPALLRPFPIVRIRGDFARGGVRITLLSVSAPRSARIAVRCTGRGCPLRSLSIPRAPARLRPFERFLAAGTVLQVRVTRAGRIGKYASFRIRAGSAPLRTDRCLMPGSAKPAACSAP
jgi:hypothetical protein